MSDERIERFMELFRWYRNKGSLPQAERTEFRKLAAEFSEFQSDLKRKEQAAALERTT